MGAIVNRCFLIMGALKLLIMTTTQITIFKNKLKKKTTKSSTHFVLLIANPWAESPNPGYKLKHNKIAIERFVRHGLLNNLVLCKNKNANKHWLLVLNNNPKSLSMKNKTCDTAQLKGKSYTCVTYENLYIYCESLQRPSPVKGPQDFKFVQHYNVPTAYMITIGYCLSKLYTKARRRELYNDTELSITEGKLKVIKQLFDYHFIICILIQSDN